MWESELVRSSRHPDSVRRRLGMGSTGVMWILSSNYVDIHSRGWSIWLR